jgi:hypothetical protein
MHKRTNAARQATCFALMLLLSACATGGHRRSWERLGEREVDFTRDHDVVEVGRSEGRFSQLRFVGYGGAIEMYDVQVVLGDGESFHIPTRLVLDRGEGRTVDLPGARRSVRRVEFVYRSLRAAGQRGRIALYGR